MKKESEVSNRECESDATKNSSVSGEKEVAGGTTIDTDNSIVSDSIDAISQAVDRNPALKESVEKASKILASSGIDRFTRIIEQPAAVQLASAAAASQMDIFRHNDAIQEVARSAFEMRHALGIDRFDRLELADKIGMYHVCSNNVLAGCSSPLTIVADAVTGSVGSALDNLAISDQISSQLENLVNPEIYTMPQSTQAAHAALLSAAETLNSNFQGLQVNTDGMSAALSGISSSLKNLYEPSALAATSNGLTEMANQMHALTGACTAGIGTIIPKIDTSWISTADAWQRTLSQFDGIDFSALQAAESSIENLVRLEQETAKLSAPNISAGITSAASQIVSIAKAAETLKPEFRNLVAPISLLDSYEQFAAAQHREIQRAVGIGDETAAHWRLSLLRATSQYVDRQVKWANELVVEVQEEVEPGEIEDVENEIELPPLPSYLGYTKRAGNKTSVEEGLGTSVITNISEKGKMIVAKCRMIKKSCVARHKSGETVLFEDTDRLLMPYLAIAAFDDTKAGFSQTINAFSSIFINDESSISALIGSEKCECFRSIKSYADEDNVPEKAKDRTKILDGLYNDFLLVQDGIIVALTEEETQDSSTKSEKSGLIQQLVDLGFEDALNKDVGSILTKLINNKIYWNVSEDERNDVVRDGLALLSYDVKDQTRQGISGSGRKAGEVDLQICWDKLPVAIMEGLNLDCVSKDYIKKHIDKALTNYDPLGCPYVYILMYVTIGNIVEFWKKVCSYICDEYVFPYSVSAPFVEVNTAYPSLLHGMAVLNRDGKDVKVHFFAAKMGGA